MVIAVALLYYYLWDAREKRLATATIEAPQEKENPDLKFSPSPTFVIGNTEV